MVNTYPVAYRGPQSGGGGSQVPNSVQKYFQPSGQKVPTPANSNFRIPRNAANDNLPQFRRPPAAAKVPFGFTKKALRFLPYVGTAIAIAELYQWANRQENEPNDYLAPGFYVRSDCGRPEHKIFTTAWSYACAASFQSPTEIPNASDFPNALSVGYSTWEEIVLPPPAINPYKYQKSKGYFRTSAGSPLPGTDFYAGAQGRPAIWTPVYVQPGFYPAANPDAIPIGQPMATPRPIPYRAIPHRQPSGFPQAPSWGYDDPSAPEESSNPGAGPTVTVEPGKVTHSAPRHRYKRPNKREKEVKLNATIKGVLGGGVEQIISALTESNDAINAIYDALPDKYKVQMWVVNRAPYDKYYFRNYSDGVYRGREKYGTANRYHREVRNLVKPQDKLRQIYKHLDKIDFQKAIQNLVMNEVEDRIIGKLSQGASGLNKHLNKGAGIQVGPAL